MVKESGSVAGQVLLLGGYTKDQGMTSPVHLVDLATGVCTPQPNLLQTRDECAVARLPDERVVCAGGLGTRFAISRSSAEVLEPPAQGATDATWIWRELPWMSIDRYGCMGLC
jgi:hypothetical protein